MKSFLTIVMIILFANTTNAQSKNYNNLWKAVSEFEAKGLPKSALEVVTQISEKAKKDHNSPHNIKSLLYKSKFALMLEENAQLTIIKDFKSEISKSKAPEKNILENILATMYWEYFQEKREQFYNRTTTSKKVDSEDFRTWDLQTLFNEIHINFQKSLENEAILKQTFLGDFEAILITQKVSEVYRPTLFDLLNHNALEFYKTDENSITKPAYKFEINNPNLLADAKQFLEAEITSKDSTSLQLHALKIYQNLLKFHLQDTSPNAFTDVNIERLNFVYQNATFNNKAQLHIETLKTESLKWHNANTDVAALYNYEIAAIYNEQGQNYIAKTNVDVRYKIKEALELCEATIKKFPKSYGAQKCKALKSQILQYSLQILGEYFLPINTYSRVLVNYKNIETLHFSIYNISKIQKKEFNNLYKSEDKLKFIKKLKVLKQWQTILKNENDYQEHSTEIIMPQLDNGFYLVFAKTNTNDHTFATSIHQVTNLAIAEKSDAKNIIYQIIDRNNGTPLFGTKAIVSYQLNYNGNFSTIALISDKNGNIQISRQEEQFVNLSLEVSSNNDTAYFGNYNLYRYNEGWQINNIKLLQKAYLFTDRSIYRPGQTAYFKGIVMKTEDQKSSVLENELTTVSLYNTNYEKIKELKLKTNEFGSVHGEFILPNNGLTGNYHIEIKGSDTNFTAQSYFSVEEYKRPKFETNFNPITETFKVNDSITIKGTALAYAGSTITNAKVIYTVRRNIQYPSWYFWYRPWFNSQPQEITHGETTTNTKGEFDINFKAIPDESIDNNSLPIFNYEITADVTDLNGETRSATTTVNVGYHALTASITVKDKLDKAKKGHVLNIDTKNLNGEFIAAKGTIKIFKLNAPESTLRPRPWSAPYYQDISNEEFKNKFPHEAFEDEHNSNTWKKGKQVFEVSFDTEKSKTIHLENIKKWNSGQYIILLESKDKFGQIVKDETKTTLFSDDDKTLADHELFNITTDKDSYSVNQNVLVTLGSSAENITITLDIEKNHKIIKTLTVPLNNNKKTITIPVTKEDLGGFALHYSFAAYNSFHSSTLTIAVPYPKTDLEIETLTFRDKLQPGTDETWSFKLKGPKGDKVSAELLASMYDASLDQFKPHSWSFNPINQPVYYSFNNRSASQSFGNLNFRTHNLKYNYNRYEQQQYDQLNWFGFYFLEQHLYRKDYSGNQMSNSKAEVMYNSVPNASLDQVLQGKAGGVTIENRSTVILRGRNTINGNAEALYIIDGVPVNEEAFRKLNQNDIETISALKDAQATALYGNRASGGVIIISTKTGKNQLSQVKARTNLQETAFFFPQLQTDEEGHVSFNFITPEALTKWKLQLLTHTKTLESAVSTFETVTQKELMVLPNVPRFLRQGDMISISSKIANLTEKPLSGEAKLILTDAVSGKDITQDLVMLPNTHYAKFMVEAKGNTQVSWTLKITDNINAIQYKIIAKSGDFSDGEQNALPVLTNRMLVTETLPMWIRSNTTRTFTLDKLKTNASTTLKHHKLSLEITSNPAWYAVQALPYLMEYPYDCNEQTFSRYYANALASYIATSNPRVQDVFNQWKNTDALLSNLEKNEELKSILIQETPWLRDAQSETEQKKRIALLFDMNKMNNELQVAKRKLESNQMGNGAWAWFNGGPANRYITQHIITGFGHLKHLKTNNSLSVQPRSETDEMINKAITYLDAEFVQEYKDLKKHNSKIDLSENHLSYTQLHYLYMRSFFTDIETSNEVKDITKYYHKQIKDYWLSRSLYAKGLMALVVDRMNDKKTSVKILKSLKENSISNNELGMYWKDNTNSWYWYQAPIETQALLIEAFAEIENNTETIDNLKIWLLKNKQTNQWKTTKATTEAVYALLLQGSDWLSITDMVDVVLGGDKISPSTLENVKAEAGTGYYKTSWNGSEIKSKMADVTLTKKGIGIAWGSLNWQYFEDLDKITTAETPLKLSKKLFLKSNTDRGEKLTEITSETNLNVGDLVRVRIELRSDRAMEFVHMKDMRAAGLEPTNVISQYKWQDNLGYYEATKDASTNFFFDILPKGVFVFEYDLRVTNAGDMSNGITTIQSMYAPEFSSHSEGIRINVN